jgi:hypothetical protein
MHALLMLHKKKIKILSKTCCEKKAEIAENCHICQLLSFYLSHNPELHLQHTKPLQSRLESSECMCAVLAF